jgi:hypothetical protein
LESHKSTCNAQSHIQKDEDKIKYCNYNELIAHLKREISESFLAVFTNQFREKINSLPRIGPTRNLSPDSMANLPIKITKYEMDENYLIRVVPSPSKYENGWNSRVEHVYIQCKKLIECLLFINKLFLAHLNHREMHSQDEISSHKEIISWLFHEIFNPGNDRLPLLGSSEDIKEKHFGKCQLKLASYISSKKNLDSSLETSSYIVEFYYMNSHPKMLACLFKINHGLNLLLKELIRKKMASKFGMRKNLSKVSDEDYDKLGGLQSLVTPFEKFPNKLKPQNFMLQKK